ncbi:hypothetical protein [Bradyrhizobium sp. CB2312]|uniref:hypothetical protein n=1 Tax=Bradyrhizobium sp. CB2312 TaxID=3039155 RepID=UPI0024B165C4|nr:hypothetical protein [Bradyrhizobium sp. CB2312]WFU72043.1 hypothetical protein QA642_44030 [Bradyrhizobium sp. CB2312]
MSLKYAVGDLTIHRIIEQESPFFPALEFIPGLTAEILAENRAWMRQAKALDDADTLILCFQSYVVKTPHHTMLIDSCIGNDKSERYCDTDTLCCTAHFPSPSVGKIKRKGSAFVCAAV